MQYRAFARHMAMAVAVVHTCHVGIIGRSHKATATEDAEGSEGNLHFTKRSRVRLLQVTCTVTTAYCTVCMVQRSCRQGLGTASPAGRAHPGRLN